MESKHGSLEFGVFVTENTTTFRIYFPGAKSISCIIYNHYTDMDGDFLHLEKLKGDIWEITVNECLSGKWYLYKADYKQGKKPKTLYADKPFADPYSRHVTARNHYRQDAKSFIPESGTFDWDDDGFSIPEDPRDLIIYETHIKDLVCHPSAGAKGDGIYIRWEDLDQRGGIPYLKHLGINAVEFLPLHKFPYFEPPYQSKTEEGILNTWNTCSRNYWGYMTSFFMAPETTFASDGGTNANAIIGLTTAAITEFKSVVNNLHKHGIAVIMDVVFNHTSIFDINPLSHHLPGVYLRHDDNGKLMNRSWTGNEFRSEHPVARQLMLDSLTYWMEEFHIDGFRFDLAGLIDEGSWDAIRDQVRSVNPNALLIAEPWGGRYVPWLFTNHGWSSWNDKFRNGIKGSSPTTDKGFIFSSWHQDANRHQFENWLTGTLKDRDGGLFNESSHSVNYLESHDGYTLGDFIRIVERYHGQIPVVSERESHIELTSRELEISKLAAFCLFISQGIVMISSGQEFARTKLIQSCGKKHFKKGAPDHDSYNKDDETNWVNFDELSLNQSLFDYYRGLIKIRKESPALRKSDPSHIHFSSFSNPLQVCLTIDSNGSADLSDYIAVMNASGHDMEYIPPKGTWEVLVNNTFASIAGIDFIYNKTVVPSRSALLLRKLRH